MKLPGSNNTIASVLALALISTNIQAGGPVCTPNASTSFTDYQNMAFRVSNDALGVNSLFSQCTDLSNEVTIAQLNNCPPALTNPINGLGLNPTDRLLYGLSPTDVRGIGTHVELSFTAPGDVADIMKADNVTLYKIGNDGGYQNIGTVQAVPETNVSPLHQVVPIVHSAASFNSSGDLLLLAYRTNYQSSANIPAGTAQLTYAAPQIVIGQISNANLIAANGGTITTSWSDIDATGSVACVNLMNKFRDDTNLFATCVVDDYLTGTNEDTAIDSCLVSNPFILDKGIHDFAVSPLNDNYYAYDSMTYDDRDVLIEVNSITNTATCTEINDAGNTTGVLSSLMFSQQNKLVAIFANQATGSWIDVNTGTITALPSPVTSAPFSDGSSLPFTASKKSNNSNNSYLSSDIIFKNGFEAIIDPIFANGFEGAGIAAMTLLKSAVFVDGNNDNFAQAGESINYSFAISNTGTLPLNSITISDPLMNVAGSIASLLPSESDNSTFSGNYVLTQSDIDNGFVSNLATANGLDSSAQSVSTQSNNGLALVTNLSSFASIQLNKSGLFIDSNNDGFAQAGESINYTFSVTNNGLFTLKNLTIADPLITVSGSLATLAVNATDSSTFSGTYTLTQADIDNGSVANLATISALDPNNNGVTAQSNSGTPLLTQISGLAAISLGKSATFIDSNNDNLAQVGEIMQYNFSVTNTGSLTLSNASITDPLMNVPGAVALLAVGATDTTSLIGNYAITQADIDAGTLSNLATVNALDPAANTVSAQSNNGVALVTPLLTNSSVSLLKVGAFVDTNGNGSAQVGETINYSFTVTNTGNVTLSNLQITDPVVTVPATLGTLAPSAIDSTTFNVVYNLTQSDIDNGFVSNLATVSALDPNGDTVSSQSNNGNPLITNFTTVAAIDLVKSAVFMDNNNDGLAQEGETINYSFAVNNTGSLTLNTVSIDDPLITVSGSLATLAVSSSDSSTFTGSYAISQNDIDAGFVSNTATVNALDPSSNAVIDQSNDGMALITNLPSAASMSLTKTALLVDTNNDGLAQAGETIDYSFSLTNTGNLTLSTVTISDPLMTVTGSLANLTVGSTDNSTFTGTYILSQADIDAGFVSNVATANASDPASAAVSVQSNNGSALIVNLTTTATINLQKFATFVDSNLDGYAQVGETIDYTFTVTNTGTTTLSNISLNDPLIATPGNIASLAPQASDNSTFSGTYTLTQLDIDNALVSNLATVSALDPANNAVTAQSNNGTTLITNLPIFSCPVF